MPNGRVSPLTNVAELATLAPSADGRSTFTRPDFSSATKMSPFGAMRITRGPSMSRVNTSILNPGGSCSFAVSGFGVMRGNCLADSVANGAGSFATSMRCTRPGASSCHFDCACACENANTANTDNAVVIERDRFSMGPPCQMWAPLRRAGARSRHQHTASRYRHETADRRPKALDVRHFARVVFRKLGRHGGSHMSVGRMAIALLAAAALPWPGQAQDATAALDAAAKAMGTATLQSLRYTGTGSNNSLGQAYTTGGAWPRFTVKKYTALVNYTAPAMRQEIVRIDDQNPPRGGGAGPFTPATGQGGIRPIPGDIIQNQNADGRTEIGALNIWLTPHGFIKGAIAAGNAKIAGKRGRKTLVAFTAFGKYTVTGTLNERNLVERVATVIDGGFTGDTPLVAEYGDYHGFAGVQLPRHIVQSQGGFPVLDIVVAEAEPNNAAALEIRGAQGCAAGRAAPRFAPRRSATASGS